MVDATTLLLSSTDASLIEAVGGVVRSIGKLQLRVLAGIEEVVAALPQEAAALVLVHVAAGKGIGDAAALLSVVTAAKLPIATLVLSDHHQAEDALALLRLGAADYLSRPLDLSRLAYLIDILTVRARHAQPAPDLASDLRAVQVLGEQDPFLYLPSAGMGQLMEQIQRVAPQDTTILLHGETGTGKTRLARLIHELSPRRHEPFLVVDCGSLSPSLIASEMFGHVRGAFTGADRDRSGKFTDAGRGTLLLDEIDALPLTLQTTLLRAVDQRVFEPVGSNKSLLLQARLITATNRALDREVAAGRFRSDLYYRLNVVSFYLPPLRERRELIPPLVQKCVAEFAARNGREISAIAAEAVQALQAYHWPGNVRELRNVIERAVALCPRTEILLEDLADPIRQVHSRGELRRARAPIGLPAMASLSTLAQTKEEAELTRITAALQKHRNNRLRAAAELGISRMTLYKKLHKYGLMQATSELAP